MQQNASESNFMGIDKDFPCDVCAIQEAVEVVVVMLRKI